MGEHIFTSSIYDDWTYIHLLYSQQRLFVVLFGQSLGVGQNQLQNTNIQIPTSNSGAGTGSGYATAGCCYGIG